MGFFSSIGDAIGSVGSTVGSGLGGLVAGPLGAGVGALGSVLSSTGSNYAYDNTIANMNQSQLDFANKNLQFQEDYAKNGLSWRVSDAANSGLSPLVGAGAAPTGGADVGPPPIMGPAMGDDENSLGSNLRNAGQDITRSLINAQGPVDRRVTELKMRQMTADTDFAETQAKAAKLRLAQQANPSNPAVPDYQLFIDRDGNKYYGPSSDSAQSSHGTLFGPTSHFLRDSIIGPAADIFSIAGNEAKYAIGTADYNSVKGGN